MELKSNSSFAYDPCDSEEGSLGDDCVRRQFEIESPNFQVLARSPEDTQRYLKKLNFTRLSPAEQNKSANQKSMRLFDTGLVLNVGYWNVKCKEKSDIHKGFIREVLHNMDCDVIAVQESLWVAKNVKKHCLGSLESSIFVDYRYTGDKKAMVLCNPETIATLSLQNNDTIKLQIEAQLYQNRFFSLNGRFQAEILEFTFAQRRFRFIFVSLHMPAQRSGFTYDDRAHMAAKFVKIVNVVASAHQVPLIVAGDFNVPYKMMQAHVENKQFHNDFPNTILLERRVDGDDSIDYCFYSSELVVVRDDDIFEFTDGMSTYTNIDDESRVRLKKTNKVGFSDIKKSYQEVNHVPRRIKVQLNK